MSKKSGYSNEELDRCTYCARLGRKRNLRRLPIEYDEGQRRSYCPRCYPIVLEDVKKLWWNRGK